MKPCIRCGGVERYKNGDCKPCAIKRAKAWATANTEKKRAAKTAWIKRNPDKAKASRAKWYANHAEEHNKRMADYYQHNKDKLLTAQRDRRSADPKSDCARGRIWYAANREKRARSVRAWGRLNVEKRKMISANWAKANPELRRIYKQNRRNKMRGAGLTYGVVKKLFTTQAGRCVYCQVELVKYHIDHIMPLALGGKHQDDNVQLLCPACNLQKQAKHPDTFKKERDIKSKL